jgi:hypothetical protein
MDAMQREALAKRLEKAEMELRRAQAHMDGSHGARTRYSVAREEHRAAEAAVLTVLEEEAMVARPFSWWAHERPVK